MSDKEDDLTRILRKSGMSLVAKDSDDRPLRIIVELNRSLADEGVGTALRAAGLHVSENMANKVFGEIQPSNLAQLERLDCVAGWERVVKLKPHDD